MKLLFYFLKGIVVGIGGIAPGLSGSVLLIVLGLYEKTVGAIGTLFKRLTFKKNITFLLPLIVGFALGAIFFSKAVSFMLERYEFQTRYLFLGLICGTVPLFYKQVKKHGFKKKFYVLIIVAAAFGFFLFTLHSNWFETVGTPSFAQSVMLGVAVAGSSIIPGVDSAAILSAFGLYELYVSVLANLNWTVLLPAGGGLLIGAICISAVMHVLLQRWYTITFSIIFGLFLSIIPNVLTESCTIGGVADALTAAFLVLLGFGLSFYLEDIKGNHERVRRWIGKK